MQDHRLQHAKVGSWFLGPKAENFQYLEEMFAYILERHQKAREDMYPDDPSFITPGMQSTDTFKDGIAKLREHVVYLSEMFATHSIPFWSPRYHGHMNMDTAMASIIGYATALLYNPNNLGLEASPYTSFLEVQIGDDFCKMLGYAIDANANPRGWGHITCDGSVANLEAIWATRSLKFYPLSLKWAMAPGNELEFLGSVTPPFQVKTCQGTEMPFKNLKTWDLLNLRPSEILDIPTRLYKEYGISASFLQSALGPYLIQTVGMEGLVKKFDMKQPVKYFISAAKHYSWPKGGAITGLGSESFVNVKVDRDARLDINDLKEQLDRCISPEQQTPVCGVVAIMGSTEHGACDPLDDIIRLRKEFEAKGLSFAIHCDAAWGGYFCTTITDDSIAPFLPIVPTLTLNKCTIRHLRALQYADSVTIDPHKSGYINYPAGGLCYRDERMKYLVTWKSPIMFHDGDAMHSVGVYGVEGSKPGAASAATWLTHRTLGLESKGYGRLLGEAVFTCKKLYCYWTTMTMDDPELIVVPFQMLPQERKEDKVGTRKAKEFIRDRILSVSNEELLEDHVAMRFLKCIGSDLMINAFACNFRIDGKPNTDVGEANYLNNRIFKRLSVTTLQDDVKDKPLFLTQSTFKQKAYGDCLRNYKDRLGLRSDSQADLVSLVNTTMSPWPTDSPFMRKLAESFYEIAKAEAKQVAARNKRTTDIHGFLMQGNESLFLVHLPMFNMANHRRQLILKVRIPHDMMHAYRALRSLNPGRFYTLANSDKAYLEHLMKPNTTFKARLFEGIPGPDTMPLAEFAVTIERVIVSKSLWPDQLESTYPDKMPFDLYGSGSEYHINHILKASPNAQLNADCVSLSLSPPLTEKQLSSGVVVVFDTVFERSLQPLPTGRDGQILPHVPGLNFQPGTQYRVSVFSNENEQKNSIATGEIRLGQMVYADWREINADPVEDMMM
ncbi:pyridoxal phosphate-dependent transferase [Aspergillus coremiiformis]|uniref:Pyridoxal phosphate-dependent transferase n=1 Tax=Aspergillus coremiiformis TaxID=138285 RepID=A0A5N6ZET5_9EURO|nr:pyridoxal phosphate-dependent transferase [Aspergillus coremiiformis]